MTTYQTGKNISVLYKKEVTLGIAPAADGATQFRASPASGLSPAKASVMPTEFRPDGMTVQARHGSKSVAGDYLADLSVGTFDALLEAALRGTWFASFTITEADMTSITIPTTSTIVAAAGSWITKGVKVGDVVRLANFNTSADDAINLRVTAVTASTLTVAEALVVDAVADTSFTLTVCKRLVQGVPPVPASFTFEEHNQDIDASEYFVGVRISKMALKFAPDATVQVTFSCIGLDMDTVEGASAPLFTTPYTISTSVPLVCVDGKVRVNGADEVDFTAFDVTFDLKGATIPVIGSVISPDVFLNNAVITANLTALRSDLSRLGLFLAETTFAISVMCVEPMSEPKNFLSFFMGNALSMGNTKQIGQDNALIETIPVNIGIDQAGGAHANTMLLLSTSAA
jgi:hypothetical protein